MLMPKKVVVVAIRSMIANGRNCKFREANRSDSQCLRELRKFTKYDGVVVVRVGKMAGFFSRRQWGAIRGSNVAGIAS